MNHSNQIRQSPIEDRSGIKLCVCKECQARYEPLPFQSLLYCSYCKPLAQPMCMHAVSLHLPCDNCRRLYNSAHMRQLPPMPKAKPGPKMRPKRIGRLRSVK